MLNNIQLSFKSLVYLSNYLNWVKDVLPDVRLNKSIIVNVQLGI